MEELYPWTQAPLVIAAPMRLITLAPLAIAVCAAGGLGFIGAGTDASELDSNLSSFEESAKSTPVLNQHIHPEGLLPVGVGFIIHPGPSLLEAALPALEKYKPAAVWLFAPSDPSHLKDWASEVRRVTNNRTKIWIQIGTVAAAISAVQLAHPDVLVVQGTDAGGHGLNQGSSLIALLPEVSDAIDKLCADRSILRPALVAAGGISDARTAAASFVLGAEAVVMGTRFLCSHEANIAPGYQRAVLAASDGGVSTGRTRLYDSLRGTSGWPAEYGGRGVLNASFRDAQGGMEEGENRKLYNRALESGDDGWEGPSARLTTYAGAGVGMVIDVKGAGEITMEVREGVKRILESARAF